MSDFDRQLTGDKTKCVTTDGVKYEVPAQYSFKRPPVFVDPGVVNVTPRKYDPEREPGRTQPDNEWDDFPVRNR
jgi:hypothetical protein